MSELANSLAARIAHEHEQCQLAFGKSLEHALAAGQLLAEAKRDVGHGRWLPWLRENFAGSARTAQGYMQLASNPQRVAHLTVRGALKRLAEPQSVAVRARALLKQGEFDGCLALLNARAVELQRMLDDERLDLSALAAIVEEATELHGFAAELTLRAERRCGELLLELEQELAP